MPGNGPHRLEFIGKTPWIFMLLVVLLIINSLAGVVFLPAYEHFAHRTISYDSHFLEIEFGLLMLLGLVLIIYRKNVRYVNRSADRR